jgi:hypothetical protein
MILTTKEKDSNDNEILTLSNDLSNVIFFWIKYWSEIRLGMSDITDFNSETIALMKTEIENDLIEELSNAIRLNLNDEYIPLQRLIYFINNFQPKFYLNRH